MERSGPSACITSPYAGAICHRGSTSRGNEMRRIVGLLLALSASGAGGAAAQAGATGHSSWRPANLDRAAFLRAAQSRGVVRATDFGARPGDGRNDAPAISAALAAARARNAAAVLLPAGEYSMEGEVRLLSGIALVGEGCGRTVLRRLSSDRGQIMLRVEDVSDVRVQGISFEHNGGPEFYHSVGFRGAGSRDVVVVDNCFNDARPITAGGDRWAVELSAETSPSRRVWVARNRASGKMQMTAGGGAGVEVLRILDNEVRGAKSNSIALSHLPRGAVFRDVVIARNRIYDALSLGVFVGPDAASARDGTYENVSIVDNVVQGVTGRYAVGIYVRAAERLSSGLTITGNVLDGAGAAETTAIRLEDDHGRGSRRIRNVVIRGNQARNFERGIWVVAVDGADVSGNRVTGSRAFIIPQQGNRNVRVSN